MKGYKAMEPDMTCRGFKYEVGGVYETEELPVPCYTGFHFCEQPGQVFAYYNRWESRVFEVDALGIVEVDGDKSCTDRIRIVRELSPAERWRAVYGYGRGYGDGDSYSDGDGYGFGFGFGYGIGYGNGYGDGSDYGFGDGFGDGYDCGDGYDYGYGDGCVESINRVLTWEGTI